MSIRVGFGRCCITPEESVPMAGYGNTSKRMSANVLDDLYATCIAFSDDGDSTALLFTLDLLHASKDWTEGIRASVSQTCGIPTDHIMVAHTHTHSGPDMYNREKDSIPRYRNMLIERATAAAIEALSDRTDAQLFAGVREMQEHMNFIRSYIKDESAPGGLRHAGEPDRRMQLVKITRLGKKDILLMNWQAHPCFTGGTQKRDISADYIGQVRKIMEKSTGSLFAFFQGASGNVNARSRIPGERITNDCETYAKLLSEWTAYLFDSLAPVSGDYVRHLAVTNQIPIDHSDDHRIEDAREVNRFWLERYNYQECNAYANTFGMNSVYHASGIMMRNDLGQTADMTLHVFCVGDLAFACAPYEMFSSNGAHIKDASPFSMTFIVTSCNTLHGYLAEDKLFDIGGYEVDFRRYPRGTAEKVADTFVELLRTLKN